MVPFLQDVACPKDLPSVHEWWSTPIRRAVAAGAEVFHELEDQDYGSRDFAVKDPEGNLWNFGTYTGEPAS